MNAQPWTIWLTLFCAFLGSLEQLLFKFGSKSVSFNMLSWITNWHVILGMTLYGISAILFITALRFGNLSILYPVIATTYLWVIIFSVLFLGESFSLMKWAGIRTAQTYITGDVVIIQDADLEYQPKDYLNLVKPIKNGHADVVYGSRFLGVHKFSSFWHYFGNKFLTWVTNVVYRARLTDTETCYKAYVS